MHVTFEKYAAQIAQISAIAFFFFLSLGTTAKSIALIFVLLTSFSTAEFRAQIINNYKTLWGIVCAALFIYIIASALWSFASWPWKLSFIAKYAKLLYLPVLAVLYANPKTRLWSLNAYLVAMWVVCISSFLKSIGVLHVGVSSDAGHVFYNHIVTGFMTAFGSYLALLLALESRGWMRLVYYATVLVCSYQVFFLNTGRTGYVVYCALMMFLLVSRLSAKKILICLLVFLLVFFAACWKSSVLRANVHYTIYELRAYKNHQFNTSLGYRVQFHNFAKKLFLEHPIQGQGVSGFNYRFHHDNPIPSWHDELKEPHSQYWMFLAEQGLIGIFLFSMLLISIGVAALLLKQTRLVLFGTLIAFGIGCFTDTVLTFSAESYLFIIFTALCFGELSKLPLDNLIMEENALDTQSSIS